LFPVLFTAQSYFIDRHIADWTTSPGYLEAKKFDQTVWYDDGIQKISYFYTGSYLYQVDGQIRRGFLLEYPTKIFHNPKESRRAHAGLFLGKKVEVTHGTALEDGSFLERNVTPNADFAVVAFPYVSGFFVLVFVVWLFFEKKGKGWTIAALLFCCFYLSTETIDPDGFLDSDEIAERGDIVLPHLEVLSKQPWSDQPNLEALQTGVPFRDAVKHITEPQTLTVGTDELTLTFDIERKPRTLTFSLSGDGETRLKSLE
jgi:hypothetical protein